MKRISFRDTGLKYVLSPSDEPVVRIRPGETLLLELEDASSGQVRRNGDRRDRAKFPYGNPVVGPIYVEGAEAGGSLAVTIQDIKPSIGQGATYLTVLCRRLPRCFSRMLYYVKSNNTSRPYRHLIISSNG